jgi:hypothetical protein
MPDPLMGFALQSFSPPAQPYAVSGADPLLALGSLLQPHCRDGPCRTEARQRTEAVKCEARREAPDYRVLLSTGVRHRTAVV